MPKKLFLVVYCLPNLAICMAFVFLILVFFIDHYFVGYLINIACPCFHYSKI